MAITIKEMIDRQTQEDLGFNLVNTLNNDDNTALLKLLTNGKTVDFTASSQVDLTAAGKYVGSFTALESHCNETNPATKKAAYCAANPLSGSPYHICELAIEAVRTENENDLQVSPIFTGWESTSETEFAC